MRAETETFYVFLICCVLSLKDGGTILNLNHLFRNAQNIASNIQSEYN